MITNDVDNHYLIDNFKVHPGTFRNDFLNTITDFKCIKKRL